MLFCPTLYYPVLSAHTILHLLHQVHILDAVNGICEARTKIIWPKFRDWTCNGQRRCIGSWKRQDLPTYLMCWIFARLLLSYLQLSAQDSVPVQTQITLPEHCKQNGCDNRHGLFICLTSQLLLQKLIPPQLIKKVPTVYGTWRFITVSTTARHLSLSWATSIQSSTWSFIYGVHIMGHPVMLCYPHLGTSLGTTTTLRAGRMGIESRWRPGFPPPSRPTLGPTQPSRTRGTGSPFRW